MMQVDAENLPSFIDGGKCKCEENGGDCLGWNIGPWNPEGKEMMRKFMQFTTLENGAKYEGEWNPMTNV